MRVESARKTGERNIAKSSLLVRSIRILNAVDQRVYELCEIMWQSWSAKGEEYVAVHRQDSLHGRANSRSHNNDWDACRGTRYTRYLLVITRALPVAARILSLRPSPP